MKSFLKWFPIVWIFLCFAASIICMEASPAEKFFMGGILSYTFFMLGRFISDW